MHIIDRDRRRTLLDRGNLTLVEALPEVHRAEAGLAFHGSRAASKAAS